MHLYYCRKSCRHNFRTSRPSLQLTFQSFLLLPAPLHPPHLKKQHPKGAPKAPHPPPQLTLLRSSLPNLPPPLISPNLRTCPAAGLHVYPQEVPLTPQGLHTWAQSQHLFRSPPAKRHRTVPRPLTCDAMRGPHPADLTIPSILDPSLLTCPLHCTPTRSMKPKFRETKI